MERDPLDIAAGLKLAGGHEALYASLVGLYARQSAGVMERLRAAIVENDLPQAERLAHTLKGSSAQIGARDVERRAALLEEWLRERAPQAELEPLLARLDESVRAALDWLRAGGAGLLRAPLA